MAATVFSTLSQVPPFGLGTVRQVSVQPGGVAVGLPTGVARKTEATAAPGCGSAAVEERAALAASRARPVSRANVNRRRIIRIAPQCETLGDQPVTSRRA